MIAGHPVTALVIVTPVPNSPDKSVKLGSPAVPKNSPASKTAVSNVKFTVPDAVAAADNSNVVALVTDAIVAPAGTPVPVTPVPALRSDVSAVVTVASVLVVVQESTLPAVVIVLPLPSSVIVISCPDPLRLAKTRLSLIVKSPVRVN